MLVKDIIIEKELEIVMDGIAAQRQYNKSCLEVGFDLKDRSMNIVFGLLWYIFCRTELIRQWFFGGWQESSSEMQVFPKKSTMDKISSNADMAKFLLEEYGDEVVKPFNFTQFAKYIEALNESSEYSDRCYSLGLRISDHIKCTESAEFLLSGIMGERSKDNDGYTTLTWWIYEKNFGKTPYINMYDRNNDVIPMTTVKELYDYLVGEVEKK